MGRNCVDFPPHSVTLGRKGAKRRTLPTTTLPPKPFGGLSTMLDLFTGRKASDCTGLSRRDFLRVGGLATLGLSLPTFFQLRQQAAAAAPGQGPRRNAVNCILLWMQGGPSHIDTLDPKP